MSGMFLDSTSSSVRRASAVVYSVATGASVPYWADGAGRRSLQAGEIVEAVLLAIPATMIWWVVAGIGLRIVGRFDVSRQDPAPVEKPVR